MTAPIVTAGPVGRARREARPEPPRPPYSPHFDSNNFLFWKYLIRRTDLEPMADFFWPYGFQWLFQESLPWSELASYGSLRHFWAWLVLGT